LPRLGEVAIRTYNLALIAFGNVGKEFLRLLLAKQEILGRDYSLEWKLTGIASRRIGWIADPAGLDPSALLEGRFPEPPAWMRPQNCRQWLEVAKADVLFEASSLNHRDGQPAIDHIREALHCGAHAVTANKGPIVHAHRELLDLARANGKKFLFESTVMDGMPIFSMFPHSLPAVEIRGFRGVLNATTNVVLTEMENGLSLEEGVRVAQRMGIAETDPSADLDGWDAAVKVTALVNVLMDFPLRLDQVERTGIRELTTEQVRSIRNENSRYKLVCLAERMPDGGVRASVRPEQLPLSDPLAHLDSNSSGLRFDLDVFGLSLIEHEYSNGVVAPAYGLLADFLRIASSS
jgi:homoserine dehydrogenase